MNNWNADGAWGKTACDLMGCYFIGFSGCGILSVDRQSSLPRPTVMLTICAATSSCTTLVTMVIAMTTTVGRCARTHARCGTLGGRQVALQIQQQKHRFFTRRKTHSITSRSHIVLFYRVLTVSNRASNLTSECRLMPPKK